ncbi:MAG TPA: DUF106 domain-containing protein [Candidatus Pacearchaeota archaeon]|nr:oxaA-like protein precursor [archaeon BMS3Abin17]HDK42660.1 DUF106 domain-containing protein [Candidatus Pacearchaeota archaeon]HDZ60397.1 DUF106 domain-containing protein [Candidatus Pacearchaeota archaeon]
MIKEWMIANPKLSIIVISFLVTFAMTFVTKKFTNQNRMKELKDIQKACQIKIKDNKGNPEEMTKIQKEMMTCSMELMKHSFKPMFITFIPLLVLFWWIRGIYTDILSGWIWWYIGTSLIASIILRKALKVV